MIERARSLRHLSYKLHHSKWKNLIFIQKYLVYCCWKIGIKNRFLWFKLGSILVKCFSIKKTEEFLWSSFTPCYELFVRHRYGRCSFIFILTIWTFDSQFEVESELHFEIKDWHFNNLDSNITWAATNMIRIEKVVCVQCVPTGMFTYLLSTSCHQYIDDFSIPPGKGDNSPASCISALYHVIKCEKETALVQHLAHTNIHCL